ncbi:bifunctional diguanylate cyclase/phosphodiesterase [Psychromonas ossibalaenae]|uniref:bifunctional diguanylate cyclase/phosphodiesterase n=1 Tax=Psychromonas ossibalaenae TaxID=444922 RepID=UPI00037C60B3|nr:bifunctional diguanylate cyclase/phosphodiesterase [Psychromonas ossibalaenae]
MNNVNKLSLRVIIPAILFAIFVLLQGFVFYLEYQQAQKRLYIEKEHYIKGIAGNLQTTLSNTLMRLEKAQAQHIVSETALDQNFKTIAIVDHNQQIILSNDLRKKYMFSKLQLEQYDGSLLPQVIEKNEFIFQYNSSTQDLIVYAPLQMLSKGNSLNRKYNGLIFIRYSLTSAIKSLQYNALISLIKISTTLLVTLFLLIYFLNRIIIKPLNQLALSTNISDLSNKIEVDQSGIGEVGLLQNSFAKLANEVKNNINRLSASEQRWLYALSGARDGVWDWNISDDNVYYSTRWKEMLGYDKTDIGTDIDEWESRIHPEDLFTVLQDLRFHFTGRNSFFENTHRVRCLNGEYRWILSRGQTVSWDADGQPLRVIGTNTDVSVYKESQEKIKQQVQFDEITQLPNRSQLLVHLAQEAARAQHNELHGAVIFIECNQYKTINDLQGHFKGDELLYLIARRLEELKSGPDFIAHLQGSEFVAVLPDLHKDSEHAAEMALEFAQHLDKKLKEAFSIDSEDVVLSCVFGIELFPAVDSDANDLLRQSAMAMKNAKNNVLSNISFFAKEIEHKILARHNLQKQIHLGLENQEFTLYFQPRIDAHGQLIGAEALTRWLHGAQGWVNAADFIPVAEDCGLILPLGDWVIKSAFEQFAQWQKLGLPESFTTLSLNVSPKQLLQTTFVRSIERYLEETQIDPRFIEIEITENILVGHMDLVIDKLNKLRDLGLRFAIDDFGTGYSSFSYLSVLPVSTLKIDQSFIVNLMQDENQKVIVNAIISMAHALKLDVVAEGIESQEQLTFLTTCGCTQFQGYYIGTPLAKKDFQTLLFKGHKTALNSSKKELK